LKFCKKANLSRLLKQVARITHFFHLWRFEAPEGHEAAQSLSTDIDNTRGSKTRPRDILHIFGVHRTDISHLAKATSVCFGPNWINPFTAKNLVVRR
jgi:hypothetical protein